jgi:putative PIG3 family NAD(P)H quinone oxidoreductase
MKAVVITGSGPAEVLKIQERPIPQFSENQVLIEVNAAGVNRPDVAQRRGKYPAPAGYPQDIPGLEVAGIIIECGLAVTRWKPGDLVCALVGGGGYAEYVAAYAGHCLPLPKGWNFAEAASLPETVFTVWHNVFQRGGLSKGEHLLVHGGTSGIGITAIQLAKALGGKVSATAGSSEKCESCLALGAENCINYKTEDFEKVLKGEGVDVVLDMVGGDYIVKNLRLLKKDGRLVFINSSMGSEGSFDVRDLMQRRLTITGSTLRNREPEFKTALAAEVEKNVWPVIEAGKFRPVIYREFSLEEAFRAHLLMESSQHIGKIVLRADGK